MAEIFLDSSYAIALSAPNDLLHRSAFVLTTQIRAARTQLVTTRAVMLEIGNGLSKLRYRNAAAKLLRSFETDPRIEIVPLSDSLYQRAFQLYSQRLDKEWGLTDCISFIVMWERGIVDALTADKHFRQAGFQTLLQEEMP